MKQTLHQVLTRPSPVDREIRGNPSSHHGKQQRERRCEAEKDSEEVGKDSLKKKFFGTEQLIVLRNVRMCYELPKSSAVLITTEQRIK